jgi:hypothetical protein
MRITTIASKVTARPRSASVRSAARFSVYRKSSGSGTRQAKPAGSSCGIFGTSFVLWRSAAIFCDSRIRGVRICGDAVMANERTFEVQRDHERRAYGQPSIGRRLLRRRALELIAIGLAFVFMAGANLDVFDATVGCIAVAAGGTWHWLLGKSHRAGGDNSLPDAVTGCNGKFYLQKKPAARRDPYFP